MTLHLQPTGFVSKHETPVPHVWLRSINRWPMPVKRLFVAVGDRLSDQALAPAVNDLRAEFGLLPVRNIVRAWYDQVAEGETIICLGDVTVDGEALAHHQDWWRRAPGTKWLVLGNHDVDPINQVRPFEGERRTVTLYAAGDLPLLLTHVPLLQVPHGAVNVHGQVHEQESPTRNRHVNVSVEQLNYRPAKLSDIRRLARRLVEGHSVPGHSTRARLNVVERVMP